jgi:alkylresorcinol/alkylpyrone synthase
VRSAPTHTPSQPLRPALADFVTPDSSSQALLERFHTAAGVQTRHLALPLEAYASLGGFTEANDAFIRVGLDLGEEAVHDALAGTGLRPEDINC